MKDKITTLISKSTISKARIAHRVKLSTLIFTGAVFLYGCGSTNTSLEEENLDTTVNTTPVATFSEFSINKNARYEGQLTATDADGDKLNYIIVTAPLHGTVILHENGCFTYTPNTGYKGLDSFSYKASDDISSCALKTVTVNVDESPITIPTKPSNLTVTALSTTKLKLEWSDNADNEEGYLIYQDGKLIASAHANETSIVICCGLQAGTTYNFEVKAKNIAGISQASSSQGTTKDITRVPNAPTELKVKAVDSTSLRLEWKDNSDNESGYEIYQDGVKVKTISAGCHCTVIENLTSCQNYTFMIKAVNKIGTSSSNTIFVDTLCDIIVPTNEAPTPTFKTLTVDEDTTYSGTLTATDPESDALTFAKVTDPSHGIATVDANGNFTYSPTANYNGSDSFTYSVSDGTNTPVTEVVSIMITDVAEPDNIPPEITLTGASTITLTVGDTYTESGATANDDRDGDITSDIITTGVVNTATAGTYTLRYNVQDSAGNSAIEVTRSVVVEALNIAPTAEAGNPQTITEGESVTLNGSGTDVDGTISSYSWTGPNAYSSSDQNPTITGLTVGTHTFTLIVTDDDGASGTDNVVVTVETLKAEIIIGGDTTVEDLNVAFDDSDNSIDISYNNLKTGATFSISGHSDFEISSSGVISYTGDVDGSNQTTSLTVTVTNPGETPISKTFQVTMLNND